jgi:hypothetical protein
MGSATFPALREIGNPRRFNPIQLATELALGDEDVGGIVDHGTDSAFV